ncbi:MAG: peptide-methionine (S)-S-oxide reductase, partial [Bacteroidota bacterium]
MNAANPRGEQIRVGRLTKAAFKKRLTNLRGADSVILTNIPINMRNLIYLPILLFLFSACSMQGQQATEKAAKQAISEADLEGYQKAYFASGCFWCVEAIYESVEGVVEVAKPREGRRGQNKVGGVVEDPATGAAAAALGGYLREAGLRTAPF